MHNLPQIQLGDYFNIQTGEPLKCSECGSNFLLDRIVSTDGGIPSEVHTICGECETDVGYFAYGSYDPAYMMDFAEEFNLEIY